MNSLVSIDPGSNKLGLAWFSSGSLIATTTVTSSQSTPLGRRLHIAQQLDKRLLPEDNVASEEPLLLGRNNNFMQRLLGYIEFLTEGNVSFVHPMTLKKFMGSGSSDKLEMALSAGSMLASEKEQNILADAISREAWDETDAICVGLWRLHKESE